MIYLDNAATTKPDGDALARASEFVTNNYFNPSGAYREGFALQGELKSARKNLLEHIADSNNFELIFTSCGTEADNHVVFNYGKRGNIVSTMGEHSAIYATVNEVKNRGIAQARFAELNSDGTVNIQSLLSLIDDKTSLVSVIHVNNETGAVNDIVKIARLVKEKNKRVVFHSDGVQAYGKIPFRLSNDIDLYSVSGHKIGGLKGTGFLIKKKNLPIQPFIYGGGQESGKRSGTENVFGIKILEYAAEKKYKNLMNDYNRVKELKELLWDLLNKEYYLRISSEDSTPYILTVTAKNLRGEIILRMADDEGLIIGKGSACSSNSKLRYSRVVLACGLNNKLADGVLRLSFSPLTTEQEIRESAKILNDVANNLAIRMK